MGAVIVTKIKPALLLLGVGLMPNHHYQEEFILYRGRPMQHVLTWICVCADVCMYKIRVGRN